ncbi:MAG: radical SAM protein [Nitrospirae bacterium]|nr:radical SAM protein [Nitrospirota bacterium]
MGIFPHLGLMYIATVLKQNDEFQVKLVDMALEQTELPQIIETFKSFAPKVVGISSYTDCLYDLYELVKMLRQTSRDVVICIGGPHVEVYANETLESFPVDCIIRGDGEYAFRELCRRVRDSKSWTDVLGIGYRKDNINHLNTPWQVENLDNLLFPERSMSTLSSVKSAVSRGAAITSICSSRGCPYQCTFCNSPYKIHRMRSAHNVVAEIDYCYQTYGIHEFFFFDDLFNFNTGRLSEICDAINNLSYKITWSFRGRVNHLDEEILLTCKNAGCIRIHFGVEAGTERMLKIYKKRINLEEIKNIFAICRKIGIETVGNFIIGGPTETKQEIETTIKFSIALNPTYVEYHVLVPYPYTEIYKDMLAKKLLQNDIWKQYALHPQRNFDPPLCEDTMTRDELYKLLNTAYKRFYFRGTYILKQMLMLSSLKDLLIKINGAFKLALIVLKKRT